MRSSANSALKAPFELPFFAWRHLASPFHPLKTLFGVIHARFPRISIDCFKRKWNLWVEKCPARWLIICLFTIHLFCWHYYDTTFFSLFLKAHACLRKNLAFFSPNIFLCFNMLVAAGLVLIYRVFYILCWRQRNCTQTRFCM